MKYLKLIKLLYLADREALLRWGRPITTDRYVSMDNGPVVSRIYSLISEEPEPNVDSYWRKYIKSASDWDVEIVGDPSDDELSQMEEMLLSEIFREHGHKNRWRLVDETHELPEWVNPHGGSMPIEYRDILKAAAKTDLEIAEIEAELESLGLIDRLLSPA